MYRKWQTGLQHCQWVCSTWLTLSRKQDCKLYQYWLYTLLAGDASSVYRPITSDRRITVVLRLSTV